MSLSRFLAFLYRIDIFTVSRIVARIQRIDKFLVLCIFLFEYFYWLFFCLFFLLLWRLVLKRRQNVLWGCLFWSFDKFLNFWKAIIVAFPLLRTLSLWTSVRSFDFFFLNQLEPSLDHLLTGHLECPFLLLLLVIFNLNKLDSKILFSLIQRFDAFYWNLWLNIFQINFARVILNVKFTNVSKKETLV